MNLHTTHPLVRALIALLLVGAFVFAFGHAVEQVDHDIHCVVCDWICSFSGLVSAVFASGVLYACCFFTLSNPAFLSRQFFLSPQGSSPPVV